VCVPGGIAAAPALAASRAGASPHMEAGRVVHAEVVMGTVVTFDVRLTDACGTDVRLTDACGTDVRLTDALPIDGLPTGTCRTDAPADRDVLLEWQGRAAAAVAKAVEWLHWVDETFSTYKVGSEVNRFDRGDLDVGSCSDELRYVVALCHKLNGETEGYFDAWATGRFDPSGVVKGWSVERASELLAGEGMGDHLVDGGGDIRLRGCPAQGQLWHVGIRHPLQLDAYAASLWLPECGIATSGTYERGEHVLDPLERKPASALASVTVIGPSLTIADAYATAALAMGERASRWLAGLAGYDSQIITPEGRGWSSPGFRRSQERCA